MVTAMVNAYDRNKRPVPCRILIDTCSTANFITEDLATILRLSRKRCNMSIGALNGLATRSSYRVSTTIKSRYNEYSRTLEFLTVPRIASEVPDTQINRAAILIPSNIYLADPDFHKPAPVQMLISAGTALSLLSVGQINLSSPGGPDLYLQKTQLGWVIGGSVASHGQSQEDILCHLTETQLDLSTFWEIEEGASVKHYSTEEQACEDHFSTHVTRTSKGRYIVALPFKENKGKLGTSRTTALKRLYGLERKFKGNPDLQQQYTAVITEYLKLGYLTKVSNPREEGFYLPHHAVVKATSLTTKTRVVFDGSAASSTGISLNQTLMVGPTIQDDLFSIILRFRTHNYVLTGDIEKMYLQVGVRQTDRKYQRVLWRDVNNDVNTYELNTVTFGLSASPYLAIRTLHQLAEDEAQRYPVAARILKKDLYVDDMLTGASSLQEVAEIRDEMFALLNCGGFNLRQCASNARELLEGLADQSINLQIQSTDNQTLKTLGIYWNSQQDAIIYTVKAIDNPRKITKRMILSEIAKIFDPLGLLQPTIVNAKLIMQELWKLELDWDESVPISIHTQWSNFSSQLPQLHNVSFPRKLMAYNATQIQLHGFCDASEKAYGACIYVRSTDQTGHVQTQLFCAKSRVSPIKKVQSIPRLELCGALLLMKLHKSVTAAIDTKIDRSTFWSDSTVVLHWINTSPHALKTFVANRVAEIRANTDPGDWRHVRTHDNPADQLSRGQLPNEFLHNPLWKTGPPWLNQDEKTWPQLKIQRPQEDDEMRKISCLVTTANSNEIIDRYSSIWKLRRIVSYFLRFKTDNHFTGLPGVIEMRKADTYLIKMVQSSVFAQEIHDLANGKALHAKSKLLSLNPFLDQTGIMRVGGRLKHADLSYDRRHPILLPKSNTLTRLLIENEHLSSGHAGIQTTLYGLRRRYWLIDGRSQVRKIILRCVRCMRVQPPTPDYLMGQLPKDRVTAARPFSNVGVDYCGPFYIKERRRRNRAKIKVYVAVFVCLVVKAVHLELVSDMTTEAFIAALRRFISRRGRPRTISSDNGTNFVGARNEIEEIQKLLRSTEHNDQVHNFLTKREIIWKFIPPLSPHFGGIWEAAVKSFKHHVRRVIGNELLCFEDMNTFIIEIESILNSRPISPMSSDPNDPIALTPGHFLIGESLTSIPEHDFTETPSNRLSTWQHIQKLKQDFWARWHKEYINELNLRHKWTKGAHNIDVGSIVVIKDDNLPPLRWLLGRVVEVHPGADGIIRTVRLKTATGHLDRNVKKLAPLPIETPNKIEPTNDSTTQEK